MPRIESGGQHRQLAQDLQSAGFSDSWGCQHEAETSIQFGIAGDESQCFAPQPCDPELRVLPVPLQFPEQECR